MPTRNGNTIFLPTRPAITGNAAVVGKKEGEGPLKNEFDKIYDDEFVGCETFEKAETALLKDAITRALEKANESPENVNLTLSGDLLNQCIGSSFGLRDLKMPFAGLYGACSTMALSLGLAATLTDGGALGLAVAATSSHFCSAERQYRYPLEYGGQRTPASQWTVTGAGAAVVKGNVGGAPRVDAVIFGKVCDYGVTDQNNMGAAMAPAAYETLKAHFADTGRTPDYYDLIVTGDLGKIGHVVVTRLFQDDGIDLEGLYTDCGLLIYDLEGQDVHAGGSGCGCSASVLAGHLLKLLEGGQIRRLLFAATGALMSPTASMQGESIPGICHAVAIETQVNT